MALSPQQIQEMDKISGLSSQDMSQMDQIAAGAPAQHDKGLIGGASSVLRSLGLGGIPDAASNVGNIIDTVGSGADVLTGKKSHAQAANDLRTKMNNNPFAEDGQGDKYIPTNAADAKSKIQNVTSDLNKPAEDTAGALSWMMPGTDLLKGSKAVNIAKMLAKGGTRGELYAQSQNDPTNVGDVAGGALLEPLMTLLGVKNSGILSKKGTNKLIENAANDATNEGIKVNWNDVQQEIRDTVTGKLGNTSDVKKALNTLIAEKTPAQVGEPSLNPNDLLTWRRQVAARGAGKGVLQNFLKGSDIEDKVSSIARAVITRNLKGLAPDITTPDKVYSAYAKLHGDAPTWIKRILVGLVAKHVGKNLPGVGGLLNDIPLP